LNKELGYTVRLKHEQDTGKFGHSIDIQTEDGKSLGKLADVQHNRNYRQIPQMCKKLVDDAIAALKA